VAKTIVQEAPGTEAPLSETPLTETPTCIHRWVIETPNGEMSRGVCRYCGAEKEFPNAAEDGLWERNVPQSRWTGRTEYSAGGHGY